MTASKDDIALVLAEVRAAELRLRLWLVTSQVGLGLGIIGVIAKAHGWF